MATTSDRPLSMRTSLEATMVALRLLIDGLEVDPASTRITVSAACWPGEELAAITLEDLLRRADAALAADTMQGRLPRARVAHSPLPWGPSATTDRPLVLIDGIGTPVAAILPDHVPADEAEANVAFVARATAAYPLLLAAIDTAVHALRSYQHGNSSTDLAREIADACEAVVVDMKAR